MDHFAGFDHLLRFVLGRDNVVRFYGPAGLIDAVEAKLRAYTWNLIGGYDGHVVLHVTELDAEGGRVAAQFSGRTGFTRETAAPAVHSGNLLLDEPELKVACATLDHGIPVLAFALKERAHINIWRTELDRRGLAIGPWLRTFKDAILQSASDDTLIQVVWSGGNQGPEALPLGELKRQIMRITAGARSPTWWIARSPTRTCAGSWRWPKGLICSLSKAGSWRRTLPRPRGAATSRHPRPGASPAWPA
jgi:ribonuclease Z